MQDPGFYEDVREAPSSQCRSTHQSQSRQSSAGSHDHDVDNDTADHEPRVIRNTSASRASARSTVVRDRIMHELEHFETNVENVVFGNRRNAIKRTTALKTVAEWSSFRLALLKITESGFYNVGMVFIIILNVVHLWSETDMRAQERANPSAPEKIETPFFMAFLSRAFLTVYTMDLVLRVYVYRKQFPKSGMNVFDSLVVILDIFLTALPGTQSNLPSMSVLRGLRMLRIVRVIRNLVAFRELYLMMQGLVSAVRAIIFGTALIFAALILWSILAVELVQEENLKLFQEGVYGDCDRCAYAFESVGRAMLTFISTTIAGDSWGTLALPLIERKPWTALILLPALLSLELGLLNVVAAVIVDRQAQARQDDEKFLHQMRDEELKKSYGRLKALFSSMDDDGSGSLTLEEMIESYRTHAEFKELMELMDIQEDDLPIVFQILDKDRSGDVTYDEFVEQLNTMRTTNSHTLLVFIKHLAGRISEQVDLQDVSMRKVMEALGLVVPKSEKDDEDHSMFEPVDEMASEDLQRERLEDLPQDEWHQDPDEEVEDFSFRPRSIRQDAFYYSDVAVGSEWESQADWVVEPETTSNMAMTVARIHSNGKMDGGGTKVKGQPPAVKEANHVEFEFTKPDHHSAWASRAVPLAPVPHVRHGSCIANTSQTGYITAAAAADLNARFLALSRHIQSSLSRLTEDAVRRAGDKALWESTLAMATLQASLPHLYVPSPQPERPVAGVLRHSSGAGLRQSSALRASSVGGVPPQRLVVGNSQPGPVGASCPRVHVLQAVGDEDVDVHDNPSGRSRSQSQAMAKQYPPQKGTEAPHDRGRGLKVEGRSAPRNLATTATQEQCI